MNPQNVIIHHSLTKDSTVVDWDAIRRYHIETNGWSDIGYHYGIERVGQGLLLQVGRYESKPGPHDFDGVRMGIYLLHQPNPPQQSDAQAALEQQ